MLITWRKRIEKALLIRKWNQKSISLTQSDGDYYD